MQQAETTAIDALNRELESNQKYDKEIAAMNDIALSSALAVIIQNLTHAVKPFDLVDFFENPVSITHPVIDGKSLNTILKESTEIASIVEIIKKIHTKSGSTEGVLKFSYFSTNRNIMQMNDPPNSQLINDLLRTTVNLNYIFTLLEISKVLTKTFSGTNNNVYEYEYNPTNSEKLLRALGSNFDD